MLTHTSRLAGLALAAALLTAPLLAQEGRNAGKYNLGAGRLALGGHDPVAYFDLGGAEPRVGKESLTHEHAGALYRFATEANRAAFVADPERFEPTHGGWCAYAMAKDARVAIDPKAFRVARGRLFLFADTDYMEVDEDWVEDEAKNIKAADRNWKAFSGESARAGASDWRPYHEYNLSGPSLAIEGYDPVAYFPEGGGEAKKGSTKYVLRHRGVLYRFASADHRARFAEDPARYEPQHGGWCSYAMGAKNEKVEVDPEAFRLTDGQLHLFFNGFWSDTREPWDEDTASLKREADAHWTQRETKAKGAG
jgi:YHS domain-containing protein